MIGTIVGHAVRAFVGSRLGAAVLLLALLNQASLGQTAREVLPKGSLDTWTQAEVAVWVDYLAQKNLEMAKNTYDLTPEQEADLRRRLDGLKPETLAYWEKHLAEFQRLRKEIKKLQPRRNDPAVRERFLELQERCGEIMKGRPQHPRPLFEALQESLPAAQVAAANKKKNEIKARWWREEMEPRLPVFQQIREAFRASPAEGRLKVASSRPMDPWTSYVELFIEAYDLDDGQQTTARSILNELQARREEYELLHREEFEALRSGRGEKGWARKSAALKWPIEDLFDELKARLDRIPRPAQRQAVAQRELDQRIPSTRPAPAASRPSRPLGAQPVDTMRLPGLDEQGARR